MRFDLLKSVKPQALLAFFLYWNVFCIIGVILKHGLGRIKTLAGAIMMVVTCRFLSITCFCTAVFPKCQRVILVDRAKLSQARPGLIFIALLSGALALRNIFSAYDVAHARA